MKLPEQIAAHGLNALLKAGADKAQFVLVQSDKHEMNVDAGALSLLRTAYDTRASLTAIKESRKGTTSISKTDQAALERAVEECMVITEATQPDAANDIAEKQPAATFSSGSNSPDLDKMHLRLEQLLETVKVRHPKAVLRQAFLDFTNTHRHFVNSNGVDFVSRQGTYRCTVIFSSRDADRVSSFNYTSVAVPDLDRELIDCGSIDTLLRQSGEQTSTQSVQGKFLGEVIITPDCLNDMLSFLIHSIGDMALIAGTSIYKDSLGQPIASPLLTLHSKPVAEAICDGYFVTSDGYAAENSTIVENGILRSLLLSLYGSNKSGKQRARNDGSAWIVEAGVTSLDDMIRSVDKGVLLARFSGGNPSNSGDFSGVAKNSYLIQNGEIAYPLSETMVSGNFADMLRSITAISREQVDYGDAILPWVQVPGVTVSGK